MLSKQEMKELNLAARKINCDKGNHEFSEWRLFDDLESVRHCLNCSHEQYKIIK